MLANVPFDPAAARRPLVTGDRTRSGRAESMRQLRTNLQFVDVDQPVRVIVVSSAVPGEGKSSTAVNLAIVFAEAGQRVMLVDADLRRPQVADYLGIEGAVGLTNVLAGQADPDDVMQEWGRAASGCCPADPSHPTRASCSSPGTWPTCSDLPRTSSTSSSSTRRPCCP